MIRWVIGLLGCVMFVSPCVAQVARPAPRRPPAAADPAKKKEAAERWVKEGREALAAAAYEAARDRFSDVLEMDSKNSQAMHGLGLSLVGLGDLKRAVGTMQGALDTEIRSGGIAKVNKPLLVNYAMVMISAKEPMRAVKPLMDYQRLTGKPDEAVLNALAVALNTADPAARKQPVYAAAVKFYDDYNGKLEATRAGQKRWGVAWKSAAEHEQLLATWKADMADLDQLYRQVELKALELDAIQVRHDRAQHLIDTTGITPSTMPYIRQELARIRGEYETVATAYRTRAEQVRKPTVPVTMSAVPLDGDAEMAVAAMASAGEANATVAAAARRPGMRRPRVATARAPGAGNATGTGTEVVVVEKRAVVAPNQAETPEMVVPKQQGRRSVVRAAAAFAVGPDLLLTCARAVEGAKEIQVTDLNGEVKKGEVAKLDSTLGLALIRVEGGRMMYAQIGDAFKGGAVQCVSLAPSIFQPTTEVIPGSLKADGADWVMSLQRAPKRVGAPVVALNKVVGVELGDREAELTKLPVAGYEAVRQFCGEAVAGANGPFAQPAEALCELLVTREVE